MPIPRRHLVFGGSGVVLAGLTLRTVARRVFPAPRLASSPAPAPSSSLCVGTSSAPAKPAPVALRPPLHPEALARFVEPLPLPTKLVPAERRPDPEHPETPIRSYGVSMQEAPGRVH